MNHPDRVTDDWLAEAFKVDRSTVLRWRSGRCRWSVYQADRYAIRAGLHPMIVWPEWGAQ
jgi:hypothetical protein